MCIVCPEYREGLNKIEGVKKATVNFSVEKATIEYDAGKVNPLHLKRYYRHRIRVQNRRPH